MGGLQMAVAQRRKPLMWQGVCGRCVTLHQKKRAYRWEKVKIFTKIEHTVIWYATPNKKTYRPRHNIKLGNRVTQLFGLTQLLALFECNYCPNWVTQIVRFYCDWVRLSNPNSVHEYSNPTNRVIGSSQSTQLLGSFFIKITFLTPGRPRTFAQRH